MNIIKSEKKRQGKSYQNLSEQTFLMNIKVQNQQSVRKLWNMKFEGN